MRCARVHGSDRVLVARLRPSIAVQRMHNAAGWAGQVTGMKRQKVSVRPGVDYNIIGRLMGTFDGQYGGRPQTDSHSSRPPGQYVAAAHALLLMLLMLLMQWRPPQNPSSPVDMYARARWQRI